MGIGNSTMTKHVNLVYIYHKILTIIQQKLLNIQNNDSKRMASYLKEWRYNLQEFFQPNNISNPRIHIDSRIFYSRNNNI